MEKTEKIVVFDYRLKDAWCAPLARVTVSWNGTEARVCYKNGNEKEKTRKLSEQAIREINEILEAHAVIFTYEENRLEVVCGVGDCIILDGLTNSFEFATLDGKSIHLYTDNIEMVRDPNAHFRKSWLSLITPEEKNQDVEPVRAREVLQTFDAIAAILEKNGVPPECLRV